MTTQWDDWLREMTRAQMGGTELELPPISRGLAYEHTFAIEADVSGDSFAADLRIAPDATPTAPWPVAFTVTVGAYASGITPVTLTLSQATVAAITAQDDDFNGLTELVFNLFHTPSGGAQYRAAGTIIQIAE